jgi:hypothetical protein
MSARGVRTRPNCRSALADRAIGVPCCVNWTHAARRSETHACHRRKLVRRRLDDSTGTSVEVSIAHRPTARATRWAGVYR